MASDHIDFLDVNFLSGSKSKKADGKELRHAKKSIWNNFSNFAGAIIRISIYVASAILVTSLIWYGINIVRHTFDNPRGRADAMAGLVRLRNAIGILIGTILFMALCIFGSRDLEEGIQKLIYTLAYIVLAIANLVLLVIMIARMFILWGLSIIGPIISVFYVFGRRWPMDFRTWIGLYIAFSMVQVMVTVLCVLAINVV